MRKEVVTYLDDIDGEPIPDDGTVHVLTFSVGNTDYTLDLSEKHMDEFHRAIAPFTRAARQTSMSPVTQLRAGRWRRAPAPGVQRVMR